MNVEQLSHILSGSTVESITRIDDSDEGLLIEFDNSTFLYVGFSSCEGIVSYTDDDANYFKNKIECESSNLRN